MSPKQQSLSEQSATLNLAQLEKNGIAANRLEALYERIAKDISEGQYPGAGIALARDGKVLAQRVFGSSRIAAGNDKAKAADEKTLWLLYSQTKPITACAIWVLAERGLLSFHEPVASYIPDFAKHGKEGVTLHHVLTHQCGFPSAIISPNVWEDHTLLPAAVSDFMLEYEPGSKIIYHGLSAHWVLAALIEAVTGKDHRRFIHDEIITPLGFKNIHIGAAPQLHERLASNYERAADGEHLMCPEYNTKEFFQSGVPGAGGFATASDLCLFYQMLLGLGSLNGARILSPDTVRYVTRNHTGDRPDEFFGMPMHRGLGVHVRGLTPTIRGLGSTAHPNTFGHGGVGTSYTWADPETKVSFTYLTNSRLPEPWHSRRLEEIMTMAHACVVAS